MVTSSQPPRENMCTPLRAAGCAINLATGAWVFSLNSQPKPPNDAPPAEERRESPGAAARALVLVLVGVGLSLIHI